MSAETVVTQGKVEVNGHRGNKFPLSLFVPRGQAYPDLDGRVPAAISQEIGRVNSLGTLMPGDFPLGKLSVPELKHFGRINDGLPADAIRFSTLFDFGGANGILEMLGKPFGSSNGDKSDEITLGDKSKVSVFDNMRTVTLTKPLENGAEMLLLSNAAVREVAGEDGMRGFDIICPPTLRKSGTGKDTTKQQLDSFTVIHVNANGAKIDKIDFQRDHNYWGQTKESLENILIALELGATEKPVAVRQQLSRNVGEGHRLVTDETELDSRDWMDVGDLVDELDEGLLPGINAAFGMMLGDAREKGAKIDADKAIVKGLEESCTMPTVAGKVEIAQFTSPESTAKDKAPLIVLPGYNMKIKDLRFLIRAALAGGRDVIALGFREQGKRRNGNPYRNDHSTEAYNREANALLQVMEENEITSVDLIAPSHSAVVAAIAADAADKRQDLEIRNMILINPGGLYVGDTIGALQARTYEELESRGIIDSGDKARLLSESAQEPDSKLPNIANLLYRHDNEGWEVSVIQAIEDGLFPPREIARGLSIPTVEPQESPDIDLTFVSGDHFNFTTGSPDIFGAIREKIAALDNQVLPVAA